MSSIEIASPEIQLASQREAEKKLSSLSVEQVNHLRLRAKSDLFFLAYGILGYDKLSPNLHGDLCKWMVKYDSKQYREILLPRSHYKSTIATISDTIRIVLPDDSGRSIYPRNLGTNTRVLIAHETSDSASRFLVSVTNHFLSNPWILALFPETTPNRSKHRINLSELELPREAVWNEPTVDTMGVGAKKQGAHYNFIKGDDLYGVEARDSEKAHKTTINWVDNLQAFLVTPKTDHIDYVGTRYKFDDVYNHIHNSYEDKIDKYIRSITEYNPITGKRDFIFPEQFDEESVKVLKKNKQVWNSQYVNNPSEGGTQFEEAWLRYFNWKGAKELIIFEKGLPPETIHLDDLDICILIDPAMTGLAGFIVTGQDPKGRIFILDAQKKEWKPPELVNLIFQSVMKWNPRVVAIEEVLFSGLFQHWIGREMSIRNVKFKIEPVKTGQKAKESRVIGLSNYFSSSQIWFNTSQTELIEEYNQFGATSNYHILDSLAQGPKIWRIPINKARRDSYKAAEAQVMEDRDMETGYGSI